MSDAARILVTGPTGTVGGPLLEELTARGLPVVAGARDPAVILAAECVALDLTRPETFDAALTNVDRVFLMRPPAISDAVRHIRPFIVAAGRRGVRHVVFLSVMGVNRALPHWRVEQDLRATTMGWTFLRPSFFAQNLETAYCADIRKHDAIRVPAGRGRTSFVDTRDVAAVAAHVLDEPAPHAGRAYTLTGPDALDYHRVASMLSAELGRAIDYTPPSLLGYRRELLRQGYPADYATVQLVINLVARLGLAARVTDTTERLLDRPATALRAYLHDRRDRWTAD